MNQTPLGSPPSPPATAAPADAHTRLQFERFVPQLIELGLLLLLIHAFEIEGDAFFKVAALATGGFAIHHCLPLRHRLPFFCALSLAAIGLVFGLQGSWLVSIGLLLIGACHLPVPIPLRALLLVLLGAGLAVMRAGVVEAPWPSALWPVLGSMFMFRLIVYLYELSHSQKPPTPWQTLAYFFMLPNPCFPLFPVVDFATWKRGYYARDAHDIYQVGLRWIFRGLYQLIAYRLVYQHFTLLASDVHDAASLLQYALSLFLLYLRVSGSFHVIVGMLHLFGFDLPETHHDYYLSSSFTDFWRRINIYWKDFMMKHFYYPVYFRLKRLGPTHALVLSTLVVFAGTWALHSYQWFWILGDFPLTGPDAVFWGVLALLVVANSLYEIKYGRKRTLKPRARTQRENLLLGLRTAGTFCAICALWSLWSSESVEQWVALVRAGLGATGAQSAGMRAQDLALPALVFGSLAVPGTARPGSGNAGGSAPPHGEDGPSALFLRLAPIALLLALSQPQVAKLLGERAADTIASIKSHELNARDNELLERGYYENLLSAQRFTSEAWKVAARPEIDFATVRTDDFVLKINEPGIAVTHHGKPFTTNRWGMRDKDYEQVAAEGTYRFALLGSSHALGFGISDGENFESLIEERLNRERPSRRYKQFEILNFAVTAYSPLQIYRTFEQRALGFGPQTVLVAVHMGDPRRNVEHLSKVIRQGVAIPYRRVAKIVAESGATASMSDDEIKSRLMPRAEDLSTWAYAQLMRGCERQGCQVLGLYMPTLSEVRQMNRQRTARILEPARRARLPLIDLADTYKRSTFEIDQLWNSTEDHHPNAAGHRLLAAALYPELIARADLLGFGDGAAPAQFHAGRERWRGGRRARFGSPNGDE